MSVSRLPDYLDHIQQAATDACIFVDGMSRVDFLSDKRTLLSLNERRVCPSILIK